MNKLLCVLITSIIAFSISGCSNTAETNDKSNKIETVDGSYISKTEDNAKTAAWPTKEWSTSTLEQQGMDAEILSDADERININYTNVYSLLVIRHGYLVYEKYYHGMNENSANPVYSVTKSVMSALTGIALREKLIQNVDQNISEILPEYFKEIDDIQKNKITIKNVLTMSGGLESIDSNYAAYFTSDDWLSYAINKPLTDNPGEKFVYNTGLTHFLSGIITKTSNMKTKNFADKYLFSQIGVTIDNWEVDYNGYYGGGSGLFMKPVDMAKFGYLYLKNGLWDGKQIIPKEWIEEATQKQISPNDDVDYGYLFWVQTMQDKVHNKEYFTYRADGAGGQKIMIVPELDMVVVITANIQVSSVDNADTQDLIVDYVIPAVK
jgi:CubicO group peptidase (beta-lactamase class C family)